MYINLGFVSVFSCVKNLIKELLHLQITGIGLRTVFALIAQARCTDAQMCEHALGALLDVLQGHAPEELHQEPSDVCTGVIFNVHTLSYTVK